MNKQVKDMFGSLGIKVIGFLVGCLMLVFGLVWSGLLSRLDSMDTKLDKVIKVVYEEETFVRVAYLEKDLKPWVRSIEEKVQNLIGNLPIK